MTLADSISQREKSRQADNQNADRGVDQPRLFHFTRREDAAEHRQPDASRGDEDHAASVQEADSNQYDGDIKNRDGNFQIGRGVRGKNSGGQYGRHDRQKN